MAPNLVIEFHYDDGDVGVHPAGDVEVGLWDHFSKFKTHKPSHIVIRPDNKRGQARSSELYAADKAIDACCVLVLAYTRGGNRDDIDSAYAKAKEAVLEVAPDFKYGCVAGLLKRQHSSSRQ